jgi:chromatin segregation and condensation protein Rec8/ScpA/Scc1 (kleisin family)
MPSDRPSLVASLRKPTPEEVKEAFLRGDPAPVEAEAPPPVMRKAVEPRVHATFKMKVRNHRRLKKLSGLIERDMVEILEEALEPHLDRLIDQHGLRDTFTKLDC